MYIRGQCRAIDRMLIPCQKWASNASCVGYNQLSPADRVTDGSWMSPMTHNPADTRRAAVALKYDAATDDAPKVIAKGRGLVAEKIMALAREQGIPMREDPDLVQMLTQIDLDQEIPPSLYKVVAELLAFVYRLNQNYQRPGSV